MQPPEQDFEFEQITSGTLLKFKNKKDIAWIKKLFTQFFTSDRMKDVFDQFFGVFDSMGDVMKK